MRHETLIYIQRTKKKNRNIGKSIIFLFLKRQSDVDILTCEETLIIVAYFQKAL